MLYSIYATPGTIESLRSHFGSRRRANDVRSVLAHAAIEKFCTVGRRLEFRLARDRI